MHTGGGESCPSGSSWASLAIRARVNLRVRTRLRNVCEGRRRGWIVRRTVRRDLAASSAEDSRLRAPITICAVYRRRNVRWIERLLIHAGHTVDVRLWALDEIAPTLADKTVGSGAGGKFDLINNLLSVRTIEPESFVFVVDDDFLLIDGTLADVVAEMVAASFDLAQPGHAWSSHLSHDVTRSRLGLRAHKTEFVEIGPAFVIAPDWRERVLPFRPGVGMGWAVQIDFYELARHGCSMGVLDRCRVLHLGPVGREYDVPEEAARLRRRAEEVGVGHQEFWASVRMAERWYRWQSRPPWTAGLQRQKTSEGPRPKHLGAYDSKAK